MPDGPAHRLYSGSMTSSTTTDFLLGPKSGQLNLHAVKLRAEEIRRTLDNLLQILRFAPATLQLYVITFSIASSLCFVPFTPPHPHPHPRSDALDKFAVINIQLQHLSTQLRPLLRHYAVHPRSVNQTNAPILPIMLATKLLPEQEAEEEELMLMHGTTIQGDAGESSQLDAAALARQAAELAALVSSLTTNGGPLDPKGPARTRLTNAVKEEMSASAVAATATGGVTIKTETRGRGAVGGTGAGGSDIDPLLAAACFGRGL